MSDAQRLRLITAAALSSLAVWPETDSWLTFGARPFVVLLALCAIAPWRSNA